MTTENAAVERDRPPVSGKSGRGPRVGWFLVALLLVLTLALGAVFLDDEDDPPEGDEPEVLQMVGRTVRDDVRVTLPSTAPGADRPG